MINLICWCNSYDMILGCVPYWETYHTYLLYIICCSIVAILVHLHSQWLINISLFELVVTYIEAHIFFSSLTISHIVIYIIKKVCCYLLLCHFFTLNIQAIRHVSTIIFIPSLRKYPVFHASCLATHRSNM